MYVGLRRVVTGRVPSIALYPTLGILLTLLAAAPLTYPGFFQSHTGYRAVYDLIDLAGRPGAPWSWTPAWGGSYDFFRMDGPLAYWLAGLVHLLGVSFLDSVKAIYAVALVGSGWSMFRLARRVWSNDAAALIAAVVYVYFPYHLAVVFVRGTLGEALALAVFPIALLAMLELQANIGRGDIGRGNPAPTGGAVLGGTALGGATRLRATADAVEPTPPLRRALAGVVTTAALVLAQPGLGILFVILARLWLWLAGYQPSRPGALFGSRLLWSQVCGLGLGVAALLPGLAAAPRFVNPDGFTPAFVYPFQLFTAAWGTDSPKPDITTALAASDQFPYQIGIAALGLTILALALWFNPSTRVERDNPARRVAVAAVGIAALTTALMLPLMEPLWRISGLDALVQFPAQLLAFVGLFLALAGGSLAVSDLRFADLPLLAVPLIIPVLAVYAYLSPGFLDLNPTQPALARFNGDEIALLDAKIIRPPGVWRHGATVELNLTWQALRQPTHDYTVFMHVRDDNGNAWGEEDSKPQDGAQPTLKWAAGQVISDTHSVQIQLAGPPEGYHLELGLYQSSTGERATTETGATEIRIEEKR